jgi:hypothetical protein
MIRLVSNSSCRSRKGRIFPSVVCDVVALGASCFVAYLGPGLHAALWTRRLADHRPHSGENQNCDQNNPSAL